MKKFDISIVITCHAEGITLHKTMLSIKRAVTLLDEAAISYEIIVHADQPTQLMESYLGSKQFKSFNARLYKNTFKDAGLSRNFAISKANGKFISLIDGDDLMSENWLIKAYQFLSTHQYGKYVAHSAITIEFGAKNSIIQKNGEIDKNTDTLLSVYGARWNSIIIAPKTLLDKYNYKKNGLGYGYEDWLLSCDLIYNDVHNVIIPKTIIFVRRKEGDSQWINQSSTNSLLHANPLLSFNNFRNLRINNIAFNSNLSHRQNLINLIKKSSYLESFARKVHSKIIASNKSSLIGHKLPDWIIVEWKKIHTIENDLFPSNSLISASTYNTITQTHYEVGVAYKTLIDQTHYDKYHYIIFVPWLVKGGADKFAINYANTIAELTNKQCLVIATYPGVQSTWNSHLNKQVDFMSFGQITENLSINEKNRLLEQIVENSGCSIIHILNSELGYDFLRSHRQYIKGSDKKVIVTSFSQSTDNTGRIFGYSHTHVPIVYDIADVITTDNQAVSDMWQQEYGFNANKILVHHQPVESYTPKPRINDKIFRVLWAARVSEEKLPNLVPKIGIILADNPNIQIDMYGEIDASFKNKFCKKLPDNVRYKGPYDGFFSLKLELYDMYLYTTLFDGMPNSILEAARAGLPIVSSKIGGIPEFIEDGKNGILVNNPIDTSSYAEAIKFIASHKNEAKLFAEAGLAKITQNFSAKQYASQIRQMLQKLDN